MDSPNTQIDPAQKAAVESWDDDADIQGFDGLQLRQNSTFSHTLKRSPRHRDSLSSRLSNRSGEDESEWQLLVGEDDASNAIKNAHNAGVPIPANIPTSALLGGTIRKLGTKKKASKDNYDDDIEFPLESTQGLKLNLNQKPDYPTVLRSASGHTLQNRTPPETPTKAPSRKSFQEHLESMNQDQSNPSLDKYRDNEEDDVFGSIPTIKVGKVRTPLKSAGFYALPQGNAKLSKEEDLMEGLEFPDTKSPLKLSARKEAPTTPAHLMPADLEIDSIETGSSGFSSSIRGSRPSGRSERSSSVTAHSPSVFSPTLSSSFTAESEEDGLEGLVLPDGPVNFGEALKRRLESVSPDPSPAKRPEMQAPPKDDFFDELDIDEGKIFDGGKVRMNRNVRYNNGKGASPSRKGATTITFTNKPSATTRIPKPSPIERPRSKMETIAENGPAPSTRRSQSRMLNHSTQSSVTSLPNPATPTSTNPSVPSTPTKRGLGTRSSTQSMRTEPTTTSAQLLKAKRSLPMMRNQPSPARPQSMYARPPSRTDRAQKPATARPKTPVDGATGSRGHIPFVPPGSSKGVSHHINTRRAGPRPTSSDSNENGGISGRPLSRLSNGAGRPKTPGTRPDVASESLTRQAVAKRTMTKPWKRRVFGDGSELDGFDDLVTSREQESKFVRQPREVQSTHSLRSTHRNSGDLRKHYSAQNLSGTAQPQIEAKPQMEAKIPPSTHISPPRQQNLIPGFARDTASSRLAREQRTSRLTPQPNRNPHISDGNLHARFKDQLTVKATASPAPRQLRRSKKSSQPIKLIRNLGGNTEVKPEKGMHYNAKECKWEGNESALASFDAAPVDRRKASTPNAGSSTSPSRRANNTTPKPALIAPFGQKKDVAHQVGGMVFDPSRMCWLKIDTRHMTSRRHDTLHSATLSASSTGHGARSVTTATEDDDEDPFAGIADLPDERKVETGAGAKKPEDRKTSVSGTAAADVSSDEDWGIGEDFDVGPEFVRRQRREEQKCERKLAAWGDRLNAMPSTDEEVFAERERAMKLLCSL